MERFTVKLDPKGPHAATYGVGSDRYPYQIIAENAKEVFVVPVDYKYIGNDEFEYYEYPTPQRPSHFTLRKNGRWCRKGSDMHSPALHIGQMRFYRDPSF